MPDDLKLYHVYAWTSGNPICEGVVVFATSIDDAKAQLMASEHFSFTSTNPLEINWAVSQLEITRRIVCEHVTGIMSDCVDVTLEEHEMEDDV